MELDNIAGARRTEVICQSCRDPNWPVFGFKMQIGRNSEPCLVCGHCLAEKVAELAGDQTPEDRMAMWAEWLKPHQFPGVVKSTRAPRALSGDADAAPKRRGRQKKEALVEA